MNADVPGRQAYSLMWDVGYAVATTARYALLHHQRYEQTGNPAYLNHVIAAADLYGSADPPDMTHEYGPDTFAHAINLLVVAYELTHDTRYLDQAEAFGQTAIDHYTTADSDLPKASNQVDHYEALTGADDLMYVFYKLHIALTGGLAAVAAAPSFLTATAVSASIRDAPLKSASSSGNVFSGR